eukprot:SAG31_NODE_34120_length_336_cov_0.864979_1_plen_44_part_10
MRVRIWSAVTWECERTLDKTWPSEEENHSEPFISAAFSPDGMKP